MRAVWAALFFFAAAFAAPQALPGVLIVQSDDKDEIVAAAKVLYEKNLARFQANQPKATSQIKPGQAPKFDAEKFKADLVPVPLEDICAQEFDEDGRLTPIAWSLGDPIFRSAVDEKLIRPTESPSADEIRQAMGKLKAGYLFQLLAFGENGQIWTQARLSKGGREVWKDEVRCWQSQVQSPFDEENARRSVVRTWIQVLGSGALKDLPQRKRVATLTFVPTEPAVAPVVAAARPGVDNKQLLIDAMKLLSQKQFAEAVNLLRDAVDAEPLDAERREALISTLVQTGEPELAAQEARRAANLMPERIGFWIEAARAWMAADRPAEALKDLNEAVARDSEGSLTRLLLGEVQIADGRHELAAENLGKALEKSDTAYVHRLRAFALAAQGLLEEAGKEQALADASEAKETEPEFLRRFRLVQSAALGLAEGIASEIRVLIQKARIVPREEGLPALAALTVQKIQGLTAYFSAPAPELHRDSQERLVLALHLLNQSAAGVRGALDMPDEDALTDAAIDLGEAIKALESARKARLAETG